MDIREFLDYYFYKEDIQHWLEQSELTKTGNKNELIDKLVDDDEFDLEDIPNLYYKDRLQEMCDDLEIPRSGTIQEIWIRISEILIELIDDLHMYSSQVDLIIDDDNSIHIVENEGCLKIILIEYPEKIDLSSNSIRFIVHAENNCELETKACIWYDPTWVNRERKTNPFFRVRGNSSKVTSFVIPTPNGEGEFLTIVKLLDYEKVGFEDQNPHTNIHRDNRRRDCRLDSRAKCRAYQD
ncbi:hypothetical protein LCGC14_3112090, partial [marine sediment metagenome]